MLVKFILILPLDKITNLKKKKTRRKIIQPNFQIEIVIWQIYRIFLFE